MTFKSFHSCLDCSTKYYVKYGRATHNNILLGLYFILLDSKSDQRHKANEILQNILEVFDSKPRAYSMVVFHLKYTNWIIS